MLAWRFLTTDQRLGRSLPDDADLPIASGKTFSEAVSIEDKNLYGWERVFDALRGARSLTICRVRLDGEARYQGRRHRVTASRLTVLWTGDATKQIDQFVCDVAERVLQREREANREPDQYLWDAISTKRSWLDGEATDHDLERVRSEMESVLTALSQLLEAMYIQAREEADEVTGGKRGIEWSIAHRAVLERSGAEDIQKRGIPAWIVKEALEPPMRSVKSLFRYSLPALIVIPKIEGRTKTREQWMQESEVEMAMFNAELERRLTEAFGKMEAV